MTAVGIDTHKATARGLPADDRDAAAERTFD
jgi:hypothetical protein